MSCTAWPIWRCWPADAVGLREETMPLGYAAQLLWPFATPADARKRAFAGRLAEGYRTLHAGQAEHAYTLFEQAHVLAQSRTNAHVRSHWAFLRWGLRFGDRREMVGQVPRLLAAALFTWLCMPRGNTGGARVGALRIMPISPELRPYLENTGGQMAAGTTRRRTRRSSAYCVSH